MGACQGKGYLQEEAMMAQISEFVAYATHGDITNLRLYLEQKKQDPNAKDRFGMTALHWACYSGKMHCIDILLQHGATLQALDHNGRNALHHACRKDQEQIVRFLLEQKKIDPNSLSESKETPLHKAVRGKAIRSVEILLHFGADPTLKNSQNRTPIEELDANESLANAEETQLQERVGSDEDQGAFFHQRTSFLQDLKHKTASASGLLPIRRTNSTSTNNTNKESVEKTQVQHFTTSEGSKMSFNSGRVSKKKAVCVAVPVAVVAPMEEAEQVIKKQNQWMSQENNGFLQQQSEEEAGEDGSNIKSLTNCTPVSNASMTQKKSLKYIAKRVTMMIRVKKILSLKEKKRLIRLLLEKATIKKLQAGPISAEADEEMTSTTATAPAGTASLAALGIKRSNSHRKYIITNS